MIEYGFGKLEDQILDILKSPNPDFSKAYELVKKGANLNA